jgi:hypothetical protein
MKMTFGDGFLFGCGFNLAILVAYLIFVVVIVVLALAGVGVLGYVIPRSFGP